MGSPLPSPVPSHISPGLSWHGSGHVKTPSLELSAFKIPTSSAHRSIERHRSEALQVNISCAVG